MSDPKKPPTDDEQHRQEVATALLRIAASVEVYDLEQYQKALDEWHSATHPEHPTHPTHPKKPEEK